MTGLPVSVGYGSAVHGEGSCCADADSARKSAAARAPAATRYGISALKRVQHRVTLRAHSHAFFSAVQFEANGVSEFTATVAQHYDVVAAILLLAPGAH